MAQSSDVTAGTNATAQQYNDLRADARKRYVTFVFVIKDTVQNGTDMANAFIIPDDMTVEEIKHKLQAGSATVTVKKDATTVDALSTTTSAQTETSITSAGLTEDQRLSIDIASASGDAENLIVQVKAYYNI